MERSLKIVSTTKWDTIVVAAAVLLVVSILFGGASRQHEVRLALVELTALPLLVIAGGRLIQNGVWRSHQFVLAILSIVVLIPLLQLAPVPPMIWTNLPGREPLVLALQLAGLQPGWATLSLTPDRTLGAALALLPPVAMFLAVLSSPQKLAVRLVGLYLIASVTSILLGAAQLASGGEQLYPWATTSAGSVNGFFANRNHLATFVLAMLPFALVLSAASLRRSRSNPLPIWLGAIFVGLVVVALGAIRSRAGIVLFPPVILASLVAAWIATGRKRIAPAFLMMIGVTGGALAAIAYLALPPILARFDSTSAAEGRFDRWPIVAQAAESYLPTGAGLGSFDPVYRSVEPLATLDNTFFNQAHNDYLEIWLEAGWLGAIALALFLVWFARRAWAAWRGKVSGARDLQRAATVAIGTVLVHSVGDYPLRTVAITTAFAMCCALLEMASLAESDAGDQRRRMRV
ncbi:O-antigen ligase [Brevundimonas basaltis]|uniref:O-antigen ligase n=1 Tax=Brevundimonas basaltis TaxID=472166 RepID=A0A7W8HZH4_9CAUL|nr:O-antigen ligase family protein [Brevundimonas basaltis]MBB5292655.1 O-antigen ligase [Brevundimonas basaltis]